MRASGILLPLFSLPGRFGIGTMGSEARSFVDFLVRAKQTYWQILPVGPTGYGDSPYQSFSAFAGNPYFIDPALLAQDGLLLPAELPAEAPHAGIDYGALYLSRPKLLEKAVARLAENAALCAEYTHFCEARQDWLDDYTLFMALKEEQGGISVSDWPDALRLRDPAALEAARARLAPRRRYYAAVQFLFYRQWQQLKSYANAHGVYIIGDIPIYVSPDSSDFWASPKRFQTDENARLTRVAGCPPDAFAADGQLWGNPLYDWAAHAAEGFAWWKARMAHATKLYDVVRIDHFRGFESYYSIPAGDENARRGSWEKGPGMALLSVLPKKGIIAEDLGYVTPEVAQLLKDSEMPGMKVLQFAFDSREAGDYLPHNYRRESVVYTGTHDNTTTEGWRTAAAPQDVAYACEYLGSAPENLTRTMLRAALASVSDTAVIPMADWLGLDASARINTPSTRTGNWQWRMDAAPDAALADEIARLTALFGRVTDGKAATL